MLLSSGILRHCKTPGSTQSDSESQTMDRKSILELADEFDGLGDFKKADRITSLAQGLLSSENNEHRFLRVSGSDTDTFRFNLFVVKAQKAEVEDLGNEILDAPKWGKSWGAWEESAQNLVDTQRFNWLLATPFSESRKNMWEKFAFRMAEDWMTQNPDMRGLDVKVSPAPDFVDSVDDYLQIVLNRFGKDLPEEKIADRLIGFYLESQQN